MLVMVTKYMNNYMTSVIDIRDGCRSEDDYDWDD